MEELQVKTGELVEVVGCFHSSAASFLGCTLHPEASCAKWLQRGLWIGSPFESSLPAFIGKFCICPAPCFKTGEKVSPSSRLGQYGKYKKESLSRKIILINNQDWAGANIGVNRPLEI